MLQHASLLQGLLTSMLIALPMAALSTVLGHCAALGITSRRLPWRLGFATMLALPFLVPKDMLAAAQVMLLCLTALIVATGGVARGALSQQAKRRAAPPITRRGATPRRWGVIAGVGRPVAAGSRDAAARTAA